MCFSLRLDHLALRMSVVVRVVVLGNVDEAEQSRAEDLGDVGGRVVSYGV